MTSEEKLRLSITRHLISKGLTFNAEMKGLPVYTRAVEVDQLVDAILEYIKEGELPNRLAVVQ